MDVHDYSQNVEVERSIENSKGVIDFGSEVGADFIAHDVCLLVPLASLVDSLPIVLPLVLSFL